MSTGACGINCNVCLLKLAGTCSTCGPATSMAAGAKLDAQQRILGSPCPILACARLNHIAYCMRDCAAFPCDTFSAGPYPFSRGFLNMQERRRQQPPPAYAPDGSNVKVADGYWNQLKSKEPLLLCNQTLFTPAPEGGLIFRFLNEDVLVDPGLTCLMRRNNDHWEKTEDPLLELATVMYLIHVQDIYPIGRDIVGLKDLKEAHFFQGPHELRIAPLLERYGKDLHRFRESARKLGGEPVSMADAAFRLKPFPRIHLYYLLWKGDEEYPPRMSVLFDRSIETILPADVIWALVNRVSAALLIGRV